MAVSVDINKQSIDLLKTKYLANLDTIEVSDGWIEIATPLFDAHGDGISVYIKQTEGTDKVIISDDGLTLSWFPSTKQLSKVRQDYINAILSDNGMHENDRKYTMKTTVSDLYSSIIMFACAIVAISHIEYIYA